MSVSQQLRDAITASKLTHYRIWKDTESTDRKVSSCTIDRFMHETAEIRSSTFDALCEYLGLELRPISESRAAGKQSAGKRARSRKRQAG